MGVGSTQLSEPPAPSSQLPLVAPVQVRTLAPVICTLMSLAPGMMVPLVGRESGMDGNAPRVSVPAPVIPPPAVTIVYSPVTPAPDGVIVLEPAKVAAPLTLTWSVEPPKSIFRLPLVMFSDVIERLPMEPTPLRPGLIPPPDVTVTGPTVPVPARAEPALETVTLL